MTTPSLPEMNVNELNDLLDHVYEYGTTAEGVQFRVRKLCEAYALSALAADRAATAPDENLREIMRAVFAELENEGIDDNDGNAPGHAHSIAGVWDSDNGKLAGKPCAWCALWKRGRAALTAPDRAANSLAAPVASVTISMFRGHLENRDFDYFGQLPEGTHMLYTAAPSVPPVGVGREAGHGSVDSLAASSPPAAALGHTPGPWQVHGSHVYSADPDRALLAQVFNPGSKASDYPLRENARLIAAAPDRLSALQRIAGFTLSQFMGPHDMALECVNVARAAIESPAKDQQ